LENKINEFDWGDFFTGYSPCLIILVVLVKKKQVVCSTVIRDDIWLLFVSFLTSERGDGYPFRDSVVVLIHDRQETMARPT
jgi:hypothetical protein